MPDVVVFGSANVDLVAYCERVPEEGETRFASGFEIFLGGKGANQAVAAARAGARTAFVGRLGADAFGRMLREGLERDGVDLSQVATDAGCPTGVAMIQVTPDGRNRILVAPGANGAIGAEDVGRLATLLAGAPQPPKVLLLQLEVPVAAVLEAARAARERGVRVILDPAPVAREIPEDLWRLVDICVPNQVEVEALTGQVAGSVREARLAASRLLEMGVSCAVVKLGAQGCLVAEGNQFEHVPGLTVRAVDTTAAGDAFAGALAAALAEGLPLASAARFANRAAALSTTRRGAQPSLPTRKEIETA